MFLLLPLINLFCVSSGSSNIRSKKLRRLIIFFLTSVLLSEIFKMLTYGESIGNAVRSLRVGLPLFSCLFLLKQGIRADLTVVWKVFLWSIIISCVLSFLSIFITLPIYSGYMGEDDVSIDILSETSGRLVNSNAAFGIMGLYLLFDDKQVWYNKGKLPLYASILSMISLILGFNRTYLTLFLLLFIYLSYTHFSLKKASIIILFPLFALSFFGAVYNYSEPIQRQVDKRILSIVTGETSITQSTIRNNRDVIYEGIGKRIKEGYWFVGLPYGKGVFEMFKAGTGIYVASKTDISLVNILLINGFLSFLLFILFYRRLIRMKYIPAVLLLIFLLASLNTDVLYNQNGIFFIIIFGFVWRYRKFTLNPKVHI